MDLPRLPAGSGAGSGPDTFKTPAQLVGRGLFGTAQYSRPASREPKGTEPWGLVPGFAPMGEEVCESGQQGHVGA